jgi:hypothetical protein
MSKMACAASILAGLMLLTPATAFADPSIFLSSPDNLNNLTVGEVAMIDVNLQGLAVGSDFIFVLNTQVLFPSSSFQPVSGLTTGYGSGYVFLYSDQPTNFSAASSLNAASAIGNFSDSSPGISSAISENGLYYSFTVMALAAGSGSISFDAANTTYAADDTSFNLAPLLTGDPLSFTISAVPEPSSLVVGVVSSLAGLGFTWCRRRRVSTAAGRAHS